METRRSTRKKAAPAGRQGDPGAWRRRRRGIPHRKAPAIYNAVIIKQEAQGNVKALEITAEVQQLLGDNKVRCVALASTDGLARGAVVIDTGDVIKVPVGNGTLGRLINVLGEPIDDLGPVKCDVRWPIHRKAAVARRPENFVGNS